MSDYTNGPAFLGNSGSKEVHAGGTVTWNFEVSVDAPKAEFGFSVSASDPDMGPEWSIVLYDSVGDVIWDSFCSKSTKDVNFFEKNSKMLTLKVICPKGARYNDSVNVEITIKTDVGIAVQHFSAIAKQSIVILKTQMDQERTVVQSLIAKADQGERDIYAILSPVGMRGYVFVEGMNTDCMHEKARDIKKARAFIPGEVSIEEISNYLYPVSAVVGIEEGDIVELVNGPFKGEKAKVSKIDETREEITVELVDAMVPIPVTVKGDSVRLVEKEN